MIQMHQKSLPCKCGGRLVLRQGKHNPFYGCTNYPHCTITVTAHKGSLKPMGTPADKETRLWRRKAHETFDLIWKRGFMSRSNAYRWLQRAMGRKGKRAPHEHIGDFTIADCQRLIYLVRWRFPKLS